MLRVETATFCVVVTLEIIWPRKKKRTAAGGAADDAGQPVLQLIGGAGFIPPLRLHSVKAGVGSVEERLGDEGLVASVGGDDVFVEKVPAGAAGGVPSEFPNINRVAKYILYRAVFKGVPTMGANAAGVEISGDGIKPLAVCKGLKDFPDKGSLFRDGDKCSVFRPVAEGRGGLELALLGVDGHRSLDLLGEPDGVKFIHPLNDALDQRAEGTGDERFRNGHNIHAAFGAEDGLIENAFLLVPGEAAELPDQQDREGGIGFGCCNHPLKFRAAVGLLAGDAGIHIDMVGEQHYPFPAGILLDLDQLRLRGKLGLVVGGDANVCRGKGGGLRSGHGDHPFGVDD